MRRVFPRREEGVHESGGHITMPLGDAAQEFLAAAKGRMLSPATITYYRNHLRELLSYLSIHHEVRETADIEPHHLRRFMAWLATERATFPRNQRVDSGKHLDPVTVHCYFRAARAFLRWLAQEELVDAAVPAALAPPRIRPKPITPLTADQVALLLKQPDRRTWAGKRDRLMMLMLLDTGLRISELLRLRLSDANLAQQTLSVKGKCADRVVPFGNRVRRELAAYLRARKATACGEALFVTELGRPLSRGRAAILVSQYGKRLGLRVHPHLLRHTAAVLMLKGGMNAFELQRILGHADLTMTRRYINLSEADITAAHRQASPADNLR